MNKGTIRVLIGSTGKMGVGLNAQKKAIAIHHLDAPWRPSDIEQRDGRVFRQKNENEEAYKFVYVTRGSFDSRLWDILERKQKFIKTYPLNPTFGINHLISVMEGFEERLAHWSKNLSEAKSDLETQKQLAAEPFEQAEKLKQKRIRYNEVMYILNPPKEEQSLDSDGADTVQYQKRYHLSDGETYDNRGIQTATDRDSTDHRYQQSEIGNSAYNRSGDREDGRRSRKVKAWGALSAKRRNEVINLVDSIIHSSKNYDEIRMILASSIGKTVADMNLRDKQMAIEDLTRTLYENITDSDSKRPLLEQKWKFLGNIKPIIEAVYGDDVQFQQRTNTLTNREVLVLAASELQTVINVHLDDVLRCGQLVDFDPVALALCIFLCGCMRGKCIRSFGYGW